MIVVRFKVQCQPEKTDQALAVFRDVIAPSRSVDGVISFDIGRDLSDPNSLVAVEVFDDRAALERQESLVEVQKVIGLLGEIVAGEPEATIFHVSSSEPWG
jgi:quinol monooxygenase YgiN